MLSLTKASAQIFEEQLLVLGSLFAEALLLDGLMSSTGGKKLHNDANI